MMLPFPIRSKSYRHYGIISIILLIYGIDKRSKSSTIQYLLPRMYLAFVHLVPIYLIIMYVHIYQDNAFYAETLLGSTVAAFGPLAIHYSIICKKCLLQKIMNRYESCKNFQNRNARNQKRAINFIMTSMLLLCLISATVHAVTTPHGSRSAHYFSFFVPIDNVIADIFCRSFVTLLLFFYQYVVPCSIAMTIAVLYYEFSESLSKFHKSLKNHQQLGIYDLLPLMNIYAKYFKLANNLQEATSVACFFFLGTQISILFWTMSIFFLTRKEDFDTPMITTNAVIIILVPFSIVGTVLCAFRISTEYKKVHAELLIQKDILVKHASSDPNNDRFLDVMLQKQFPQLMAAYCVELTPKLILGLWGSLFTYGMLILNITR
ncbi:hypothetical protein HNY73_013140 [Argiope bruennichi]|uniref:Uncharacterized protein n=1 Tax=Argiope bruennichi TaxID=94029 RepID=A0A8T0EZ83_ARGBR|nr:hypothetical protein HNY73_013140 [Argiope bruennichi]